MNKQQLEKMEDKDLEIMTQSLKKIIRHSYKPKLSSKLGWVFGDIAMFTIICLSIIFRPINLIIGGLIAIIILLII